MDLAYVRKAAPLTLQILALVLALHGPLATALPETKTLTAKVKAGDPTKYTCFKVVVSTEGSVLSAPGWTVCAPARASYPREYTLKGGCLDANNPVTITHTNPLGSTRATVTSGGRDIGGGKKKWVGKCNDPIAYAVVEGGVSGTTYLGYSIPPGQFGYFYQMYPNPQNPTTVLSAVIVLASGSQVSGLSVLSDRFPHASFAGNDLEDLEVPPVEIPDGGFYEFAQYMEEPDAIGGPGIATSWSKIGNTLVMDFSSTGGLTNGSTGSLVAYCSPHPPATRSGNLQVNYAGGVTPPCTGLFFQDILAPDAPIICVPSTTPLTLAALCMGLIASALYLARRHR